MDIVGFICFIMALVGIFMLTFGIIGMVPKWKAKVTEYLDGANKSETIAEKVKSLETRQLDRTFKENVSRLIMRKFEEDGNRHHPFFFCYGENTRWTCRLVECRGRYVPNDNVDSDYTYCYQINVPRLYEKNAQEICEWLKREGFTTVKSLEHQDDKREYGYFIK